MKTIGLIGGMSWESTIEYYRIINEDVRRKLVGLLVGQKDIDAPIFDTTLIHAQMAVEYALGECEI